MHKLLTGLAVSVSLLSTAAFAEHKARHNPPGQDRACLVTTTGGEDGQIVDTKWLPRKAAKAQADDETTFVGTNPIAQTEEGCNSLDPD